jgi:hypothetical protein
MSACVGIDVHRKRSQVAVVAGDGQVQLNRNVVNGQEPMLRLTRRIAGGHAGGVPGRLTGGAGGRGCWRITGPARTWCIRCGARRSPRRG